ncbi:MAG: response regulator [Acidobacteriota bacterium]
MNILLVDDDWTNRTLLGKLLEAMGHKVVIAAHGKEGLEVFCEGQFDMVLTDFVMPEINGLEMLEKIIAFEEKPRPVIVLFSAFAGAHERMEAARLGVDMVMNKPLKVFELVDFIKNVEDNQSCQAGIGAAGNA